MWCYTKKVDSSLKRLVKKNNMYVLHPENKDMKDIVTEHLNSGSRKILRFWQKKWDIAFNMQDYHLMKKSKVIFEEKYITAFDEYGNQTVLFVPAKTILVDDSIKRKEDHAVIHECIHISLHRLFYHLQSYYRKAVGKAAPDF